MFQSIRATIALVTLLTLLTLPSIVEACSLSRVYDFTYSCTDGKCQLKFVEESAIVPGRVAFLGAQTAQLRPVAINRASSQSLQPAADLESTQANGLFQVQCSESGCDAAEPISLSASDALARAQGTLLAAQRSYATQVSRTTLLISSFVVIGLVLSVWRFGIYKTSFIACFVFVAAALAHFNVASTSCDYGIYDAQENWLPLMLFAGILLGLSIWRSARNRGN